MGTIRDSKSLTAIQQAVEKVISDNDPTIDLTTGTAVKDVVVDAPSTQMRALAVLTDFVGSIGSLDDLLFILSDEAYLDDLQESLPELTEQQIKALISGYIDGLAANSGITRVAAVQAQYTQRFWRVDNNGGSPVTVPVGTQVQNLDGSIKAEVKISTPQIPAIDTSRGLYFVSETVVAITTGGSGNTALESLSRFVAAIPSVATSTGNTALLVEGRDEENDADLAQRIKDSFKGRNLNTITGYKTLMKADPLAFTDARVVGPGDALMTRLATGGIDIYAIGGEPATDSETQVYSSVKTFYLLSFQPALTIQSVVGSISGTIAPSAYQLSEDTGTFADSAKARNQLEVLTASAFSNGETLTITYTYDALVLAAQNQIESDDNNVPDADVLVKAATQVPINLDLEVVLSGSVDEATVQSNIQADFAVFLAGGTTSRGTILASFGIGENIDKSDLLSVLTAVDGVDRIDLDTFLVSTVRGGTPTVETTDPVVIADNEYARAGTVTFL